MWPDSSSCAAVISFDFDAEEVWIGEDPANAHRPGTLSQGTYGAKVAVPAILAMLDELDIRASFFIPGRVAERHPYRVEQIIAAGHEVERRQQANAAADARRAEIRERLSRLTCPICDGHSFDQQMSREDSQMGFTTFRMQLLICRECSYVLHFAQGQSWFVPG